MTSEAMISTQPDIGSGKVLTFPRGIPGFETYTTFRLFHKQEKDVCAYWLESFADPNLTLTLVEPSVYDLNYELHLSDEEQALLEAESAASCAVFLILSKRSAAEADRPGLNAHIGGPIVINVPKRLGLQKVITRPRVNVSIVGS